MAWLTVSFKPKANFVRSIMRLLKSCGVPKRSTGFKETQKRI